MERIEIETRKAIDSGGAGDACDIADWRRLLEWIREQANEQP